MVNRQTGAKPGHLGNKAKVHGVYVLQSERALWPPEALHFSQPSGCVARSFRSTRQFYANAPTLKVPANGIAGWFSASEELAMSDLASAIGVRAEEHEFVAELKSGSEAAFALLIAQYSHPVYSLIARNLRDPADAADVTQEVFVKVFRNISGFHGDASLRTWIYRIALHEASNQRRWWNRHKKQELTIDAPIEDAEGESFCLADALACSDASPYDCAARKQLQLRVTDALHQLPEVFREVVVLREIEGFGYEEIAEILDVNLGTVKSRLTRGRAALREALVKTAPAADQKANPKLPQNIQTVTA
jgi:RNA polymerase sigma-70 factor (ECF subfamily)